MGKKGKLQKEKSKESGEKKKLAEQNLEEFLDNWDDEDDSDTEDKPTKKKAEKKPAKPNKKKQEKKVEIEESPSEEDKEEGNDEDIDEEDEEEGDSDSSEETEKKSTKSGAGKQKKYISSLKDQDPEFYEFLKENDEELLNFDESSDEEEEGNDNEKDDGAHKPPESLEVASDESDFEDDDTKNSGKSKKKLTQPQIDTIIDSLQRQPNLTNIHDVIEAFRGAVASIGAGEKTDDAVAPPKYIVEGGTIFNSVIRMCVAYLQPALKTVLKLDSDTNSKPEKSKKWRKVEKQVRVYLLELVTLLARVNEPSVFCVLLKHVHSMLPYYQAYQKGAKALMSRLINIWSSSSTETPRILAFMCLVKLARNAGLLEQCVKAMYLSYIKNCKFTSPSTLPNISFMKRSLVEMFGLDHNLAYYQAFVYIRQLAIHLRNAITTNKKDAVLAVYNWQFIHSLELWGALVGHCSHSETIKPLIYPLVQVIIGTAKLIPTPKYFPLRFHCARILREISSSTGTFIPVLPLYLEVLNTFNFKKKSKKVSMKPMDFSCILKLSKSQLLENGFKDATIEEIYGGMLSYLADNSNKIAFPELVTPMIFQLKDFLKNSKVQNYSKKIKTLLDKSLANQKMIDTRRKHVTFGVAETQKILVWEAQVANDGTPLLAFYKNWKKNTDIQQAKRVSEQEKLDDYAHIPALKKNHKKIRMKQEAAAEVGGFLSGSDDDFDDEENFKLKEERGKKRKSDDVSSNESDEEESDEPTEKKSKKDKKNKNKKKTEPVKEAASESDDDDNDDDGNDEVEDLKLEDLDSDSDLEDDYGGGDDGKDDNEDEDDDSSDDSS